MHNMHLGDPPSRGVVGVANLIGAGLDRPATLCNPFVTCAQLVVVVLSRHFGAIDGFDDVCTVYIERYIDGFPRKLGIWIGKRKTDLERILNIAGSRTEFRVNVPALSRKRGSEIGAA